MIRTRIAELRKARGWSQADLGNAIRPKTSGVQVQRLETGGRKLSLDWMEKIAGALGCKVSDLLPDEHVHNRLKPDEQAMLDNFRAEPNYDPAEMSAIVKAVNRMISQQRARRAAKMALDGDPALIESFAEVWADLDDRQRNKVVELLRTMAGFGEIVQSMAAE